MFFGGFHIRLIERIDAHNVSRNGGGHFPDVHLLTQLIIVVNFNGNDGMTVLFQSFHLRGLFFIFILENNKNPVFPIS